MDKYSHDKEKITVPGLEARQITHVKFISKETVVFAGHSSNDSSFLASYSILPNYNLEMQQIIVEPHSRTYEGVKHIFQLYGDYIIVSYVFIPGNYYEAKYSIYNVKTGEKMYDEEYGDFITAVAVIGFSKAQNMVRYATAHWGIRFDSYSESPTN
jgi:hypothetical protein